MAFHIDYRPTKWEDVVGNVDQVKALRSIIVKKSSHTILLQGPSGVGKTTLARISCNVLGCGRNVLEIDGATYTGVNDMRGIQEMLRYQPFGPVKSRAIVLDECHRLSRQAWDSLLKSIEEPPPSVYWFLCTTEISKVPRTIVTRCSMIALNAVGNDDIRGLVESIMETENIELAEGVLLLIVKQANGSPRQALVNLALVQLCKTRASAATILQSIIDSDPIIELCRFLVAGKGSWSKAMAIVQRLATENPESVRIIVANYTGKALQNAKTDREALNYLSMLEAFSTPYNPGEGNAPLLRSIGQVLFSG